MKLLQHTYNYLRKVSNPFIEHFRSILQTFKVPIAACNTNNVFTI